MELLTFLKITSDAITAASGMFGLLTEFKDKHHRVTRNGKIAVIGIVAGFLVSALISVRDSINSARQSAKLVSDLSGAYNKGKAEMKDAYERESRRTQRPLGHFHVEISASNPFNDTPWEEKVRNYLKGRDDVAVKDLPDALRRDPQAFELPSPEVHFAIFRAGSKSSCDGIYEFPDLYLTRATREPNGWYQFDGRLELDGDTWVLRSGYDLRLTLSSQAITSTEDLPGAVLKMTPTSSTVPHFRLAWAWLTMGDGQTWAVEFKPFNPGATDTSHGYTVPLDTGRDYCYKFPEKD